MSLAAPATARQSSRSIVRSFSTPATAHGAKTSHGVPITSSGSTVTPPVRAATARARSASTSAISTEAPSPASAAASAAPTWPAPWISTRTPCRSSPPSTWATAARTADSTPRAVQGEGSSVEHETTAPASLISARSATVVPMSTPGR